MAHPQHEEVRQRYQYCCGYCRVSEIDCGGELVVDHYHPVSQGGTDSEEDLVYACMQCNSYKSDFWTEQADDVCRILHPLQDDLALHIRETEICILEGLTETGRFHIEVLHLNRPELVAHRQRKQKIVAIRATSRTLAQAIETKARVMARMAIYLAYFRSQNGHTDVE